MTPAELLAGFEVDDRLSAQIRCAKELEAAASALRGDPESFQAIRWRLMACSEILRVADEAWPI